ncbi:S-adenosyl-L-methionine-dependent methyltransferase [Amylostereum chailletii]|nr:S-adenosyl-L-methionine-dependent methyltransferase [Amylostereum chailletii]
MDAIAELRSLVQILTSSIDTIEDTLRDSGFDFPSPHTPFTEESEAARYVPAVMDAVANMTAAATQLASYVRPPTMTIVNLSLMHAVSAALNVIAEAHVPEVMRDSGSKGMHVIDLARPSGMDPLKLARLLRLAATKHVFVEVSPDVFAHNRASSLLDTGKSVDVILSNPIDKHTGVQGLSAWAGSMGDEFMKTQSYLPEAVLDPVSGHSTDMYDVAFNRAFNTKDFFFGWYELPENRYRLSRFGYAMDATAKMMVSKAIVDGLDWRGLGEGAVVVDVGSGVGAQALILAKECPNLRIVLQDRGPPLEDAKNYWKGELPGALDTGRVTLQEHDFRTPQPVKNASVFLMRRIMHDYSDDICIDILRHLRDAASPSTRLVIVDNVTPYACATEEANIKQAVNGSSSKTTPAPLLANRGDVNLTVYLMDILMMGLIGGLERTEAQFRDILEKSGWKLERVYKGSSPFSMSHHKVIAVPA